jgi:hypothetical protein
MIVLALGGATLPAPALACACCADAGQRLEDTTPIDAYSRGEIGRLRFSSEARFLTTAAFPEDIKGVTKPADTNYRLNVSHSISGWQWELSDGKSSAGRIAFALPSRMTRFEVDPRGMTQSEQTREPKLYKEWRLKGQVTGTGIFTFGEKPTQATLILHGRGNGCANAEDFTHWTLTVVGPRARFSLLGTLETPTASRTP